MDITESSILGNLDKPTVKSSTARGFALRKPDFVDCWSKIENVINNVMLSQPCSTKSWDDSFFDVYSLCTSTSANRVQLYASVTRFFIQFVEDIRVKLESLNGIDLIESYSINWKNYDIGVSHVNQLCGYLNRMLKRDPDGKLFSRTYPELAQHFDGNAYHILALSRVIWQKFLLDPLRNKLYNVIWNEFVSARTQEYGYMPPNSVHLSLKSFIDVCFASDKERETLMHSVETGTYPTGRPAPEIIRFYVEFFEERFLKDTEDFFKKSPVVYDQTQTMYNKMSQSSAILESEARLCKNLLFLPTVEKALESLRALFVLGPMDQFVIVLPTYVSEERKIELNLAFKLLSPFKEIGLNYLVQEYETHVAKTLINQLHPSTLTPDSFVSIVCQKHYYFMKFANEVFDGSQEMNDGYRRAVETVVNEANDREPFYAAKMIARYMDLLLKKSARNKGVGDLEDKMDDAVTVFRFIKDKDTFLKIYQRLFSVRLLSKLYNSLQMESQMIEKLKNACGNDYTNKLVRMYTDFENSKQLSEEFFKNQKCECKHREEDEITVIQTCAWPVVSSKEDQNLTTFKIPAGLGPFSKCFKDFYESKHSGRVLNYAYHVSTADILVNIGVRPSTVTMTVPQSVMLLSFLNKDTLKISQLGEEAGLTFEYVCNCIRALIEFKLLKTQTANREFYTPETQVELNLDFSSPRSRVHLPPPAILVNRAQDPSNVVPSQHETAQDRKAVIECSIVRAMKIRKVMKHSELVKFILSVTQSRFVPTTTLIKSCIESLIDKHFIQRTEIGTYQYLA